MSKINPAQETLRDALALLNMHYDSFMEVAPLADKTSHPVPIDTRGWSQILVSILVQIPGLARKKGADLEDGSDVKGASTWKAIDTPRFNGVLKAGTKGAFSDKIESLDQMPFLFFVLWDHAPVVVTKRTAETGNPRCRVWVVRPQRDKVFRAICELWYGKKQSGDIRSNNFQLHPPRGLNTNIFRNTCGNLEYPLLFQAERSNDSGYEVIKFDPTTMKTGMSKLIKKIC